MTILAICKETAPHEKRVAGTPDTVKRFCALGFKVRVETGAGQGSHLTDAELAKAGAQIMPGSIECVKDAGVLLCVGIPEASVLEALPPEALVIGTLSPYGNRASLERYAQRKILAFAMELMPRISRAQSMDVLSSQSNLAGYRAVIDAVAALGKATPMMMTAAGTVPPAKVLVLGAGVAGLQAIATAKRLGAVVFAFDVRPAVKEQVESLGAKFIEVQSEEASNAETKGGYAREMSEEYKQKQAALIHETLTKMDIAITTALIPGKPAPVLITEAMVAAMKPGSVIVDLAVGSGGNCPLSRPEQIVDTGGVLIIGHSNMASRVAGDASALYARNLYNFVATFFNKEKQFSVNYDDELVKGTLLTKGGAIVHPLFL